MYTASKSLNINLEFNQILFRGEEFAWFVFLVSRGCCVALPCGAMCLSAVYDCGNVINLTYFFCKMCALKNINKHVDLSVRCITSLSKKNISLKAVNYFCNKIKSNLSE